MAEDNVVESPPRVEREAISDQAAVVAANIERFLNNHTREGGRMRSNMVARPIKQDALPASTSSQEAYFPRSTARP